MTRVRISVDVPGDHYRSLCSEARRQDVSVETLVERMMQRLLAELEREEAEGTDHPVSPA